MGIAHTLQLYAPCDSLPVLVVEVRTMSRAARRIGQSFDVDDDLAVESGGFDVKGVVRVDF